MNKFVFKNRCLPLLFCFIGLGQLLADGNKSNYAALSCHSNINVSLNEMCQAELEANDILSVPHSPGVPHTLELTDKFGNEISSNIVDISHLWTTLTAKVTNTISGNSCWGEVAVEDKKAPEIACSSVEVTCNNASTFLPTHEDNCSSSQLEVISETIMPQPCADDIIKVIQREYIAVDGFGNKSQPCLQTISLLRLDFDNIVYPDSLLLSDNTNLLCSEVVFDEDGFPSIEQTRVPTFNGQPLFPIGDLYCNLGIDYEDFLVTDDNCVQKYMRSWRVYESHCSDDDNFVSYVQVIEIADSEDPEIVCPSNTSVSTSGGNSCTASVVLPLPTSSDDCNADLELNINYSGGLIKNVTSPETVTLDAGVNVIRYTVYDGCDNSSTCNMVVTVDDNTSPLALCDNSTVVSLRSDGTAIAPASSFDAGSNDDCSFYKTVARKANNVCDCRLPEYNDLDLIGERNGRYYYISNIKRYAFEAFSFSEALGGSIAVFESEDEYDWIMSQVRQTSQDSILFGLSDKLSNGQYFWPNHTLPVFTRWAMGQPDLSFPNVIANENDMWETIDGNTERLFFIYELSNPCGFSDFINFCCEDSGNDPMIVLRAIDRFGRYNECMMSVEVQDKIAPQINCPSDVRLDCGTEVNLNNLSQFGDATATDKCFVDIRESVLDQTNDCGSGRILRRFSAKDSTGISRCTQIIRFNSPFTNPGMEVVWPDDYISNVGSCNMNDLSPENLPEDFGFPDFSQAICSRITASYTDQIFSFTDTEQNGCFKILRTWTLFDDCQHDDPDYVPLTYQQSLKIGNTVAPTIQSGCADLIVSVDDNCDGTEVEVDILATDDCTPNDELNSIARIDFNNDGPATMDQLVRGDNRLEFTEYFTVGMHSVTVEFEDKCGNRSSCVKEIEVRNAMHPVAVCVGGLSTTVQAMDLDDDGNEDAVMAIIRASSLDSTNVNSNLSGSYHPCGFDISFSFSSNPIDTIAIYDCSDVGEINTLNLWVTDEFGNTAVCTTTIDVQDDNNSDLCEIDDVNTVNVTGRISTMEKVGLSGVLVELEGANIAGVQSNSNGDFQFPNMNHGGYYTVRPVKDDNPLNGVTTLDLVKIQRHILGIEKLESPYHLIAADSDNSGDISVLDLIDIRKLILGINDNFPHNKSWKIIDALYEIQEFQNLSEVPEYYEIFNLSQDMDLDFVGVKIGDVDNSFDPLGQKRISIEKTNEIIIEDILMTPNQTIEVPVTIEDLESLQGFQLNIDIDLSKAQILGVRPILDDLSMQNFNLNEFKSGSVKASWNKMQKSTNRAPSLFTVIIKNGSDENYLSELIQLNHNAIKSELYFDEVAYPLALKFNIDDLKVDKVELFQNTPNPWSDNTEVKFISPLKTDFVFNLYDVNGQLLYKQMNTAKEGVNSIQLDRSMIGQVGVLFYELLIDDQRFIQKMIVLK